MGAAVALGKRVIVVGDPTLCIFCMLPQVENAPTLQEAIDLISDYPAATAYMRAEYACPKCGEQRLRQYNGTFVCISKACCP